MTREERELLLKDLCTRLPYGVLVLNKDGDVESFTWQELKEFGDGYIPKPYLRPMSSMTEEEKKELEDEINKDFKLAIIACKKNDISKSTSGFYKIDWLNAHHFDYRGLIEKGLAISVTEENNPYKG